MAERMRLKHRLYNTGFSGGKIVVNANPDTICKETMLRDIGDELNRLAGKMYTGCDLNVSLRDMQKEMIVDRGSRARARQSLLA